MPAQPPPQTGVFAALWLPTDDNQRLLKPALAAHLAFLRESKVDGVLALGSTGEFPRFTLNQRAELLESVAQLAGSLNVLANVSSIRLDEAIALGQVARNLGLPGIALMPPNFFPISQDDMLEFFLRVADAVQLPVYLYNFPELTSNRIGLDTIASFADRAPMAGIKQSGSEFAYHRELIGLGHEKHFAVFSGADTRLPEAFALGAAGCIGGLVNFVPELMVRIYASCRLGAPDCTLEQARMETVGRVVNRLNFPLSVAAGLEARGFAPGAPKTIVSARSQELYEGMVRELSGLFATWRLLPLRNAAAGRS